MTEKTTEEIIEDSLAKLNADPMNEVYHLRFKAMEQKVIANQEAYAVAKKEYDAAKIALENSKEEAKKLKRDLRRTYLWAFLFATPIGWAALVYVMKVFGFIG